MSPVNNATSSQLAYSYLQSKNKISGLVSGMDIESIMEKLMKAESSQMEKLQQQKQRYEWKRDAYRDVNTKLNTFQQDLFVKYGLYIFHWYLIVATLNFLSTMSEILVL